MNRTLDSFIKTRPLRAALELVIYMIATGRLDEVRTLRAAFANHKSIAATLTRLAAFESAVADGDLSWVRSQIAAVPSYADAIADAEDFVQLVNRLY